MQKLFDIIILSTLHNQYCFWYFYSRFVTRNVQKSDDENYLLARSTPWPGFVLWEGWKGWYTVNYCYTGYTIAMPHSLQQYKFVRLFCPEQISLTRQSLTCIIRVIWFTLPPPLLLCFYNIPVPLFIFPGWKSAFLKPAHVPSAPIVYFAVKWRVTVKLS